MIENKQAMEKMPAGKFVAERKSQVQSYWQPMNPYKSPEIIFTGPEDSANLKQFVGDTNEGSIVPDAILASASWRNKSVNGVVDVDPSIVLVTEKTEYSEGYQFDTGTIGDLNDSSALKTVKNVVEGVNAGINTLSSIMSGANAPVMPEDSFISKYTGMRYLKGIQSQGINEMSYIFRMGSSGLFDAYKEVVEPIVALVCCFAPVRDPDNPGFLKGPAPTKSTVVSQIAKILYQNISSNDEIKNGNNEFGHLYDNEAKKDKENSSEVSAEDRELYEKYWIKSGWGLWAKQEPNTATYGQVTDSTGNVVSKYDPSDAKTVRAVAEKVRSHIQKNGSSEDVKAEENTKLGKASAFMAAVENAILTTLNQASEALIADGKVTTCSFKIGHMLYGPYFAGNINWAFDYTHVDENGWPTAGYVKISDLKPLLLMERYDISTRLIENEPVYPINDGRLSPPLNLTGYHTASPFGYRWVPTAGTSSDCWYKDKNEFETMLAAKKLKQQWHGGIDLSHASCKGDTVFPIYDGKIVYAANTNAFGNCVIIKHDAPFDTYMSLYAHLQSLATANALRQHNNGLVTKGSSIGNVGGTNSYAPHLHFSIFRCSANETSASPGDNNYRNKGVDPASVFSEIATIVSQSKVKGYIWDKDGAWG